MYKFTTRVNSRLKMRHLYWELGTAKNTIPLAIYRLRIGEPQAAAEQVLERGLLRDIETFVDPADVPKVKQALSELTPTNYSEQLHILGVNPPDPGYNLNDLLNSDAYVEKESYCQKLLFKTVNGKRLYRKSFLSYPRRWGKSVMIEAAAKILRWVGLNEPEGRLNEAKQPVLMLDFSGTPIDRLPGYICQKIAKLAKVEGLKDLKEDSPMLQLHLEERDVINAIKALSEELREKDRMRPLHILIDEYDYPVIKAINPLDEDKYARCMDFYADFFAATKSVRGALVVTGVSRIGMAGLFSGGNHLDDVTFEQEFNGLLGLTWSEIVTHYGKALPLIARLNNLNSIEELRKEMIRMYDGYRWSLSKLDTSPATLFNPYSVHNLLRKGSFERYWTRSGDSKWIITQGVCKGLLRSMSDMFMIPKEELLKRRIEYKTLGVDGDSDGGSLKSLDRYTSDHKRNRLLVALHSGYLTVKGFDAQGDFAYLGIPNDEVLREVSDELNRDSARWTHYLDEGLKTDDMQLMMKALTGDDGFLQFFQEASSIDLYFEKEKGMDISEAWMEKMISSMFLIGNVLSAKTQFKVPKEEVTAGAQNTTDIFFKGNKYGHLIELKMKCGDIEKVVTEQLQKYASSKRLKQLSDKWKIPILFWVASFDPSHSGKKEAEADVRKIEVTVTGSYEMDKDGNLQLRSQ